MATGAVSETDRLNPDAIIELLRTDDEVVNAILMNRHWTQLRLEITERRIMANGDLRETLGSHLSEAGTP